VRYPESVEVTNDDGSSDVGVASGVGAFLVTSDVGGGVLVGSEPGSGESVSELPVVAGPPGGAEVSLPVGGAVTVALGAESAVVDGVAVGDAGLAAGRGRGACGLVSTLLSGSRKNPMPSPATASTEPTAFCAARARRRARTPDRRRAWCAGSKGVCSRASRIIRDSSLSK
jgi:hypothetical protein